MHAGNAERADAAQHVQTEAGGVDRHHHVRAARADVGHDGEHAAAQGAEAGEDFDQPHDVQVGHGEQRVHALGQHAGAGDPGEDGGRVGGPQRGHQAATEDVAAGLASDEVDQWHASATWQGGGAAG